MNLEPCKFLSSWNWESGSTYNETLGPYTFSRNYFDCAKYFFDGEFNVAQFDKKIFLYHGSAFLAANVVAYPVGADFYEPVNPFSSSSKEILEWLAIEVRKEKNWDKAIDVLLTEIVNVSSAWFADPETAAMYSNISSTREGAKKDCKEKCVFAYETRKPITVFILDDPYNIGKILMSPSSLVPDDVKNALKRMFGITNSIPERLPNNSPFTRFFYSGIQRFSATDIDRVFNKWFCTVLSKRYDGYGASTQLAAHPIHRGKFHLEFAFCNPIEKLRRSYANNKDWQFVLRKNAPPITAILLNELMKYETLNINYHAGHLFAHSVWTMLYTEYFSYFVEKDFPGLNRKLLSFIALLHDIGKMNPNDSNIVKNLTRKKFIYIAQPEHPRVGALYIKENRIPITNSFTLQIESYISPSQLFEENNVFSNYNDVKNIVALIIDMHWEFGRDVLRPLSENFNEENYTKVKELYLNKIMSAMKEYNIPDNMFYYVIHALLIISLADVFAAQPFPSTLPDARNVDSKRNAVSEFFPYLGNVSKIFRGSNIPEKLKENGFGFGIVKRILFDLRQNNEEQMDINGG